MTDPSRAEPQPAADLPQRSNQWWRVFAQPLVIGGMVVALSLGIAGTLGVQEIGSITPRAVTAASATARPTHKAEKMVYVPLIVGTTTLKDAEAQLQDLGLKFDVVAADGTSTPGLDWFVSDATPSRKNVRPGSTVNLTAQAPVAVPNFIGGTIGQAKSAAQSAGVAVITTGSGDDWNVSAQDIPAGTPQPSGTVVTLTATEPPQFDTYTVTGNGTAGVITYSTGGTGSSQASNVRLPWTFQVPAGSGFLYVSAQDGSGTTITCTITGPSGDVLASNTATGRYSIAQCNE